MADSELSFQQFNLKPIEESGTYTVYGDEMVYELDLIYRICDQGTAPCQLLQEAVATPRRTLGFAEEYIYDYFPEELTTFRADKSVNAYFYYGDHSPGERNYQQPCGFNPGDKVLCIVREGWDIVIPCIVVGPISEEWVKAEAEKEGKTYDQFTKYFYDWDWDMLLVRPLVKVSNSYKILSDVIAVSRVYVFPYKIFKP